MEGIVGVAVLGTEWFVESAAGIVGVGDIGVGEVEIFGGVTVATNFSLTIDMVFITGRD